MDGGYISCGKFQGEDKSGSAIGGVLRSVPTLLSEEEATTFNQKVATGLLQALDEGREWFEISPEMVSHLAGPLTRYMAHLNNMLGNPHPWEAPDLDEKRGIDPIEAKYGAGPGWQLYCTHDLLRACEISQNSGKAIVISFD